MDWLIAAWRFLKSERNQKTLAFVGAGIAAVAIGGWQVYTHFASSGDAAAPAPAVTASGGGVASGGDINITQSSSGTLIVGDVHGVRPEDYQRVSEELGVTKAALTSFFKILEQRKVAPEDLDSTLREFAKRYKALEADLARSTSDDPEVAALRAQAREALEAGAFDRAEELLNEASAKDLAAAERQEAVAKQRRLSAAQSKAQNGHLKWTQFAYREAAEYFRQAAALLPADADEKRAEYLNRQGYALDDAGDYRDAEGPYTQALALRENALGPEHPDVAESLNNLAELYRAQGRYAEAELLYERALAIDEKALGPEHPALATDLNNLAGLYHAQGRYAKAEPFFKRALVVAEKTLGPEHPNVATFRKNYAISLRAAGRAAEADALEARITAAAVKAR